MKIKQTNLKMTSEWRSALYAGFALLGLATWLLLGEFNHEHESRALGPKKKSESFQWIEVKVKLPSRDIDRK